ncbi:MAG TPA: hypothetical protein EYN66_24025 [Myxococcales bacterium]|nr:hypothetical protein [Myxococcales bacterium]
MATELLKIVAAQKNMTAPTILARLRLAEISGRVLRGPSTKALYKLTPEQRAQLGTIADEVDFRKARTQLFQKNAIKTLNLLEDLLTRRPQSPFFQDRTMLRALRWRVLSSTVREKRWLMAAKSYLQIPPMPRKTPHWVDIHMLGGRALSEVGLPQRAVHVYLHLLRQGADQIQESNVLISLAQAYAESGDSYRADLTVQYLIENYKKLRKNRDVLRLQAALSLKKGNLQDASRISAELTQDASKMNSKDALLTASSALKSIKTEGVHAARNLLSAALRGGHDLTVEVSDDLAMAAGDCEHLVRSAKPIELASGVQLLWAASCLSRDGRLDEALTYLQAAHAYRSEDLSNPELWPLIQLVGESVQWWSIYKDRIEPPKDEDEPADKSPQGDNKVSSENEATS